MLRPERTPILPTKLRRPPTPPDLVSRPRLLDALARGSEVALTLVSAPAGYGKSVLVSQGIEQLGLASAWLSLDESDSDLGVFVDDFLAALDTIAPGSCPSTRALRATSDLRRLPLLAGHLIRELDQLGTPCVIALDDYHALAHASPVHELVDRLLAHDLEHVHLILLTRRDPPLHLARLRANGRVAEIRMQDLRFTAEETAEFLRTSVGRTPGERALGSLQAKIEGWAAGLRLVALAARPTEDLDRFVIDLDGGFAHTRDYLLDEVMAALGPEVRARMLESSILDSFCPDLLEAVCGSRAGSGRSDDFRAREFVDRLRSDGVFVVPLDGDGEWFRYHHLFRDLLLRLLRQEQAQDGIDALHARASRWLESRGLIQESIRHSLAAGEAGETAEIVERHRHARLDEDRWDVVESWLEVIPEGIEGHRPQLLLARAWTAYRRLQLPKLTGLVQQLEPLLAAESAEPMWLSELDFFRGVLLYWDGEGAASARSCEAGLARFCRSRGAVSAETQLYLALAQQMTGDAASASDTLRELERTTDPADHAVRSRVVRARVFVHLLSGDLAPAGSCARQLRTIARNQDSEYAGSWGRYAAGIVQLQSLDLDEAVDSFRLVADRRHSLERRAAVDSLAGLALSCQLAGEPDRAMDAVQELIAFAAELGDCESLMVAESCRARILVARGELEPALEWARSAEVEAHVPGMLFWLEDPSLTLARVRIAEGSRQSLREALELLGPLRIRTEAMHRTVHMIEVLVLEALALEMLGRAGDSRASLTRALALAGPRGWIRPFVEAGPAMAGMLRRLGGRGRGRDLARRVLTAVEKHSAPSAGAAPRVANARPPSALGRVDIDTLTNREVDVLELLAQRLQNSEIAARLFISDHTVGDHLKHIYQKLRVHNRRQAVTRARQIGALRGGQTRLADTA